MSRGDLTDRQWKRLQPLLPPQKPRRGRPAKNHRRLVDAILWIDRTGAPWRDLSYEYGPWQTAATRFYRWRRAGVWEAILPALQQRAEGGGKPMAIVLTSGQRHEQSVFEALMEQGAVKRGGRGRPKLRPKRVVADKGYNSGKIRGYLRR